MRIPNKMQNIIDKYNADIKNGEFDVILQDLYDAGGRTYVQLFLELIHDAEVEFTAPLFTFVDNKLYKRVD